MPHLTVEEREKILKLRSDGLSQRAIGEIVGIPQSSVSRILRNPVNRTARRVAPAGQRWCYKCESFKPVEEFWKHKKSKDGLCGACKDCMSKTAKANRSSMRYRAAQVYGLTLEQYDELRDKATACPICHEAVELHLDHDDATGKIREFICGRCNRGLGLFGHSAEALRAAADYLEKHSE